MQMRFLTKFLKFLSGKSLKIRLIHGRIQKFLKEDLVELKHDETLSVVFNLSVPSTKSRAAFLVDSNLKLLN